MSQNKEHSKLHGFIEYFATLHNRSGHYTRNLRTALYHQRKIKKTLAQKGIKRRSIPDFPLKGYTNGSWHALYENINGIKSDMYVPDDLFFVNIANKLVPRERISFYTDKNCYDKLNVPCKFPNTLGRVISGAFLSDDYELSDPIKLGTYKEVIIKPSIDSGSGKGVIFLSGNDAVSFIKKTLTETPHMEYIIQEPVQQLLGTKALAPDSINTLRIMTMNINGSPSVLSTAIRMGRKGSRLDNVTGGGMYCGVRKGQLLSRAYDEFFVPFESHPETGVIFKDVNIPEAISAENVCQEAHKRIPELGFISWDVAIDKDGTPIIIEANVRCQGIFLHQVAHGPLFGDNLPDILELTRPNIVFGIPID